MIQNAYIDHLSKDKKLAKVIAEQQPFVLDTKPKIYLQLCRSIMGQQLSTKVASVIYQRFLDLYKGDEPTPEQIAETAFDELRAIGLSNNKTRYLQEVAHFTIAYGMEYEKLQAMTDDKVIEYLTAIKGVGRWTVEMLLMFTFGREDIFAIDDLGIQQAMTKLYKLDNTDKKLMREKMLKISKKWKPYRTYACLHLWAWKDFKVATPPEPSA